MIIQSYEFAVRRRLAATVYRGQTTFGFFSRDALAQQVGIREAKPYERRAAGASRAFRLSASRRRSPTIVCG